MDENLIFLSDIQIQSLFGKRLKALRLQQRVTQQETAEATQISEGTIKRAEKGVFTFGTLIALLRFYGKLDQLQSLLKAPRISPLELAQGQRNPRQRVRHKKCK